MSDVRILRLSTGEDVIAKVIDKNVETTKLNKPFVIIPHQQGPGKPVQLMMNKRLDMQVYGRLNDHFHRMVDHLSWI